MIVDCSTYSTIPGLVPIPPEVVTRIHPFLVPVLPYEEQPFLVKDRIEIEPELLVWAQDSVWAAQLDRLLAGGT